MTLEQIKTIFESTPRLDYEQRRFAFRDGMRLLFDLVEDDDTVYFSRDQIWYSYVEKVKDKITQGQCVYLAERGWFVDENSFSFFC